MKKRKEMAEEEKEERRRRDLGISVRHFLHRLHLNVFIIFIGSAFAATLVSALAYRFHLGNDPHYAMAASVLLLVPGVPLMNSFSDILKGHANMGFGRWLLATVILFSQDYFSLVIL